MNKTIKGAGAAVAAATLLLGNAGSLAYWSDVAGVDSGSVASGELSLAQSACDTTWSLNGGTYAEAAAQDDPATANIDETVGSLVVPGDTLTKSCSYLIQAAGDHLTAKLEVTGPTFTGAGNGLTAELKAKGVFTVAGASVEGITSADDGKVLEATITVDFPFGDTVVNDSQALAAILDDYTVTATQTGVTP
jgi:alternate signal-mediated exported protein